MIYSDSEITPENLEFDGVNIPVYTFDAVIVGAGAAGLGAACALLSAGYNNIAIVTESMKSGASKNPAENNSVYYKIALNAAPGQADSVRGLAEDYFGGFSMDGDMALVQAAYSARCFYRLIGLGVDFPQNIYGEFAEYGDPARTVDAGPFTAKKIAEAAEKYILNKNIPVFNRFRSVSIITAAGAAAGLLAIDKDMQKTYADEIREYNITTRINNANKNIFGKIREKSNQSNTNAGVKNQIARYGPAAESSRPEPELPQGNEFGYVLFKAANTIYAVGGPAGIYADETHLYPPNMTCSFGAAFTAGVKGKNLTETAFKGGRAYYLNGGLDCDIYSESNIKRFFPIGEAAAVFGTNAPEGAPLAAAQITALRAAEKISGEYNGNRADETSMEEFGAAAAGEAVKYINAARLLLKNAVRNVVSENVPEMRKKYQRRFSDCCMAVRPLDDITLAVADCRFDIANFINDNKIDDITYMHEVFENYDILVTQYVFLQAARNYILSGGKSRGSYTVLKKETAPERDSADFNNLVSFVKIKNADAFEIEFTTRKVKDIPDYI